MNDLYQTVTDTIVAQLESGTRPWVKPWEAGPGCGLPLRSTGEHYNGINILLLWSASAEHGYTSPYWFTYKQAQAIEAQVRKGEHGHRVVYANTIVKPDTNSAGEETQKVIPFLKQYTVFNACQIDGLPAQYLPAPIEPDTIERNAMAEAFIARTGADIRYGGASAFYAPSRDSIQIPDPGTFLNSEGFYATVLHELTHWTGPEKRCNRVFGKRFGDAAYAAEELVAELGAAFLCAMLGITPIIREDHASYLAHWIDILKTDSRAIFTAASAAQKAVDYLQALQASQTEAIAA